MAHQVVKMKEYGIQKYEVFEVPSIEVIESICAEILNQAKNDPDFGIYVLDLPETQYLDFKVLRPLTRLGKDLKTLNKKLYIQSRLKSMHSLLASQGLTGVVVPIQNIDELKEANSGTEKESQHRKVDVNFINPFIDGVIHVLKVQCGTECHAGKPYLKQGAKSNPAPDIAGVIGISNPRFMGSISICFSEKTFLFIISKMFGEEFSEITQDLEDGAGELLNMIFGHAKRILNENGYSFEKALPTVVRGQNITVNHVSIQSSIVLPFKVESMEFYMEICTENN